MHKKISQELSDVDGSASESYLHQCGIGEKMTKHVPVSVHATLIIELAYEFSTNDFSSGALSFELAMN